MLASFKAMIVVVLIATVIFRVAKPIALQFSSESDFVRRRNIWFVLTITAFVSPSFWLFALIAAPLLLWAGKKDTNSLALYLLLMQVIPDIPIDIPVVGINKLFELDNYRLLSFCILLPTAWRLRKQKDRVAVKGLGAASGLLLAYGALQVALFVHAEAPGQALAQESFTDVLRRAFLFIIDTYLLYVVASRTCTSRRAITEALASLCLACVIMAPIAVFESLRHWLLYFDLSGRWGGNGIASSYYMRGAATRAEVSTGHPLELGYILAIAFGCWLYLQSHVKSKRLRVSVVLLLWLGLLAAYARGPWLGAVIVYFAYAAAGPRGLSRLFKSAAVFALIGAVILASPLGERIIKVLPFFGGSVDTESLTYRQQLAERSWQLIQAHPLFGDQYALAKMEDLRQGEGIIDFVNTYAQITLFYGYIGLSLFLGVIIAGLMKAYRAVKKWERSDPDLALLGASLVACIVGTLFMIAGCSFIGGYAQMYYVLAGLSMAYANLSLSPQPKAATVPAVSHAV
jgi:O-antigen ligase